MEGTTDERKSISNPVEIKNKNLQKTVVGQARLAGWLVTFSMNPMGQCFELRDGRYVIGCDSNCDIRIYGDGQLSREHAILIYRNEKFILGDNMSTHGTYVNGQEILSQIILNNYDEIRMGNTLMILVVLENFPRSGIKVKSNEPAGTDQDVT